MEPLVLEPINAMPAPTWHRLSVNHSSVAIPEDYRVARSHRLACSPELLGPQDAFARAMDDLQLRTFGSPQAACSLEMAQAQVLVGQDAQNAEGINPLDRCALSTFQAHSSAIEATKSVHYAFETGMGKEAYDYLRRIASTPAVIQTAPASQDQTATLIVEAQPETIAAAALDVVISEDSSCKLNLVFDGTCDTPAAVGASLRIFVGRNATLNLTITQTLPDAVLVLDDLGIVLDEQATLTIEQNVFGSDNAHEGCAVDLRGEGATATLSTRYLGQGHQKRDFNYLMRHHGKSTESTMEANGVLADHSAKTLRGTIDFVRGAKGAQASELETVLLTDKTAVNRTVPVILCGEDDVAGNHGATIGSMNPEQLFYLESRGLTAQQAQAMALQAAVESAYLKATDSHARASLLAFGKKHFSTFEDAIE